MLARDLYRNRPDRIREMLTAAARQPRSTVYSRSTRRGARCWWRSRSSRRAATRARRRSAASTATGRGDEAEAKKSRDGRSR